MNKNKNRKNKKKREESYTCQFCGKDSLKEDWVNDKCPRCYKAYDVQMAQDSEE